MKSGAVVRSEMIRRSARLAGLGRARPAPYASRARASEGSPWVRAGPLRFAGALALSATSDLPHRKIFIAAHVLLLTLRPSERRAKAEPKREARREARAAERNATTRCFACRGLGHAARDCPSALNAESTVLGADEVARATADVPRGKETVGICFRCGSTEHILAKCRRAPPKVGSELPFATCFICAAKVSRAGSQGIRAGASVADAPLFATQGHLASQCPSNAGRGVYPRGGSCKLCSSVEHLARDCPLSLRAQPSGAAELGIAAMTGAQELGEGERKSGADEDDFHTLARRRVELARGEKKKGPAQAPAAGGKGKKVVSF